MLAIRIVLVIQLAAGLAVISVAATVHDTTTRVLCVVAAWAMVATIETWLWRKRATRETEH